jgi:hypothetical protein
MVKLQYTVTNILCVLPPIGEDPLQFDCELDWIKKFISTTSMSVSYVVYVLTTLAWDLTYIITYLPVLEASEASKLLKHSKFL